MAKLNIPTTVFEKELTPGSVQTTMKNANATQVQQGLYNVPFKELNELPGFNVRVDTPDYLAHVADLKAKLKSEGYYRDKPMAGYVAKEEEGSVIYLTDGYTRRLAILELIAEGAEGWTEDTIIPTIIKASGQTLEDLTIALVNGNEGRPLTPYERAIVVKRLIGMNVEPARIADRMNITTRYVDDLLVLAGAPSKVRNLVINGKVSATEAIKQVRKNGSKAGETLEAATAKAAAAGKDKATGKDVKAAAAPATATKEPTALAYGVSSVASTRDGKVTTTLTYHYKAGAIVPFDEIKPVRVFEDAAWWNFIDENTKKDVLIEEDITIIVKVIRKEVDDTFADPDAPATATPQLEDQSNGADEVTETADEPADEVEEPAADAAAGAEDGGL